MGFALVSVLPAWLHRRTVGGAAERSSRWQSFRKATGATTYYKRHPITRDSVIELADFYRLHAEFFNSESDIPAPAPLASVWGPLLKTFAINPWFRLAAPVETLLDPAAIPAKGCEVLAAPVGVLISLATRRPATSSPGYGIVAFTGISQAPLTAAVRDRLWAAWRAPVFEQFRGFQGELLAWECEAFAGLHFDTEVAVWEERGGELLVTSLVNLRHPAWRLATGRPGRVEQGPCDCGSPLPRIVWEV